MLQELGRAEILEGLTAVAASQLCRVSVFSKAVSRARTAAPRLPAPLATMQGGIYSSSQPTHVGPLPLLLHLLI